MSNNIQDSLYTTLGILSLTNVIYSWARMEDVWTSACVLLSTPYYGALYQNQFVYRLHTLSFLSRHFINETAWAYSLAPNTPVIIKGQCREHLPLVEVSLYNFGLKCFTVYKLQNIFFLSVPVSLNCRPVVQRYFSPTVRVLRSLYPCNRESRKYIKM